MKRTYAESQEHGQLGIIESISLRNFMCHDNLSFNFDPHMNFIIGRNGSGKSAILTGIILALGGKCNVTGRYSNVKGFIKTGKSSATVAVTLKNCGPDAYKPDEFGKKIIVERHFTVDGLSSYRLKSEAGRLISNSKEELTNILNVMDIQVDNPVTVLTQEISRNFLVSKHSRPQKLYELFFRGTGLHQLNENYRNSVKQKEEANDELNKKRAIIPEMEKDIKKSKAVIKKSTLLPKLRKELMWANVAELEKKKGETEEAFEAVKKEYSELKIKLDSFEAEVATYSQNIGAADTDKKKATDNMNALRQELNVLNQRKATLSSEYRQLQGTSSSNERTIQKLSSEIANLERIINDIGTTNENALLENKARHQRTLENLKNEIRNITSQIEMHTNEKSKLFEHISSLQNKVVTCNAEIQEIKYEMVNIQKEKQQLTEAMVNRVKIFDPEMVNLLSDVKSAAQAGRFKVKPKGPIGLYINVRQPEWTFAIQECLKVSTLRTFVCDNHSDADLLTKIFNKHYQRNHPSIITTKFYSQVYDVSNHKTVCEHPTVLDMLEIDDPVITNCLIDQARIENILLIADPSQALQLMLYNPPNSCRFAYTPNGDQYCHSPFRNYSCRRRENQVCLLKTVNADDIRIKNEQLVALNCTLKGKQNDLKSLNQQISVSEQELKCKENDILQFRLRLNQTQMKLREEENSYEEPKRVDCLNSDLILAQKVKHEHEELLASCAEQIKIMGDELASTESSIENLKRTLQFEQRNFYALSDKFNDCQNKKEKYENAVVKAKDQLKILESILKDREKALADDIAAVKLATSDALIHCPRMNTERSSNAIKQIITELQNFIKQHRNGDLQTATNECVEKIENCKKAKLELDRLQLIQSKLENMMRTRLNGFEKICRNTSVRLTCHFTSLLRENAFSGFPNVDFAKQTLDINAKPTKIRGESEKNALTQLSGGERSFITIAFLLSLWETIHMPFRILDEYDVFMDSNNRHLSINLLVNEAKTNKEIQYIFLSPLEMPVIDNCDDVKVHKMPDPRN